MNTTALFSIKVEEGSDSLTMDIEGKASDLINLFATVIDENEDLETVITAALMVVHAKRAEEEDGSTLEELMMRIKPTAQA